MNTVTSTLSLAFIAIAVGGCTRVPPDSAVDALVLAETRTIDAVSNDAAASPSVPAWAADAIFYQIFPERFRNGDSTNDPTRESLEFPDIMPQSWAITPWTSDWYARAEWERELGDNFYEDGVFHRRYGGDLQGVLDKLEYLDDLGINAIYFNPVFYARSLHKYDGNSFHHVDPHFGPDPAGDFERLATESADPKTWQWTAADKLFLKLVREAHARGIRIVIDGVFNHTGRDFFAFADIRQNQQQSPYEAWYIITQFDDPATPQLEFRYKGWWGIDTLPEFANNEDGTDLHAGPRDYIFACTQRWMDPNNDGDPSDGIDGWRLDVANEVPAKFWHDWNGYVRQLNPEAYTVAEIWDDPQEFLDQGGFSATMNYHGFAFGVKGYLIDGQLTPTDFGRLMVTRLEAFPRSLQYAVQNLIDSHDTDRLASMIVNANAGTYLNTERFDYDIGERASPRHSRTYDVRRPNEQEREIQRLVALFQATYVGPPLIYYGTEAGMWGGDDPCDRKPMVWGDLEYQPEQAHPHGAARTPDTVEFEHELCEFYQRLFAMRNRESALRRGEFELVHTHDDAMLLAFRRTAGGASLLVVINRGEMPYAGRLSDDAEGIGQGDREQIFTTWTPTAEEKRAAAAARDSQPAEIRLPPRSAAVYRERSRAERGRVSRHAILAAAAAVALALCGGCGESDQRRVVTLWHQMRPQDRAVLRDRIADFESRHPQIRVRALYKETEELRVGVASAVLAGTGPELVYGPSDVVGIYVAMAGLRDMSPWFTPAELAAFDPRAVIRETLPTEAADDAAAADAVQQNQPTANDDTAAPLVFLGDRFGNHLALVYNRNFIETPPQNTDELVAAALANTVDEDGDGQPDRYGIVWNYTEPFFVIPFLTGFGSWVFDESDEPRPALDTAESVAAYQFVSDLHQVHHVLPASSDYEAAAALFLANKAAMIIDGDWSWQNYVSAEGIDAAVAPLPVVASTGRPMAPMIAAKGFCLTVAAQDQAAEDAMQLVQFLTSAATQQEFLTRQRVLPSRLGLWDDPEVADDPTLQASVAQLKRGRLMPHDEQMRAVWDAMRPAYQQLMGGQLSPAAAARSMQQDAVTRIELMTRQTKRDNSLIVIQVLGLMLITGLFVWQFKNLRLFVHQWRRNWMAYLLVLPSVLIIFLTVLFPFVYNVLISFSDMSLRSFRDWQLVGLANYRDILTGDGARDFWWLFMQTIAWTGINVTFHVVIGVFLAVLLNGQVVGKSFYRVVLVVPWAVPAYITAISWRGMFDNQFGSVNHLIAAYNGLVPDWLQVAAVNWLGTHGGAFAACSIANVWLGFPFMMIIALGGLQGIPAELYEAARIDRASRWMQFRHITLPLLKPVLLPSITLGVIWTFNNLNIVWLVSNGGEPGDSMHILVSRVYKDVFNLFLYGRGAAFSMVIFVILLGFAVLFLRRSE